MTDATQPLRFRSLVRIAGQHIARGADAAMVSPIMLRTNEYGDTVVHKPAEEFLTRLQATGKRRVGKVVDAKGDAAMPSLTTVLTRFGSITRRER